MTHLNQKNVAGLNLFEIPGEENGPTILLLHGYGADAKDLISLSEAYTASPRPSWLFPDAPHTIMFSPSYTGKAWFPIDMPALQKAMNEQNVEKLLKAFPFDLKEARLCLENLIEELNIPRSKLILGGFSQGAILAVDVALHHHEPSFALLLFSGALILEAEWTRLVSLHAKTTFFQSHGLYDSLLPFTLAKELESFLHKGHLKGKLHPFPGGHEIPQSIFFQLRHFLTALLS